MPEFTKKIVGKCVNCYDDFKRSYHDKSYYTTSTTAYFCSGKCEKEFGSSCAEHGVRRLGQVLVRYKKDDRRLL